MRLSGQPFATTVLVATALHFGAASAQTTGTPAGAAASHARHPSAPATTPKADPLVGGAEIFENLTESAPTIDAVALQKSLSEFETLHPAIARRLSPVAKQHLDRQIGAVRDAWRKGDRASVALQSIEAYRLLQEAIDHRAQPVPLELPLLDYAGFKLNALLLSPQPDWKQIAVTSREASRWWAAIRTRITDKALRHAMDHTIAVIKDASTRKDRNLLGSGAKQDLDLVDRLEAFFNAHASPRP